MANLADVVIEDSSNASTSGNSERARKALSEAVGEEGATTGDASQPTSDGSANALATVLSGDAVPEKFRGKTMKDVLDSYGNVESRLGSMANELGVQRQLTDRLLDLKRHADLDRNTPTGQRKAPVQVTAAEILDKPAETLDRVLSQRDEAITEEVNRQLAGVRMSIAEQAFRSKHSDFQTVVSDPSFAQWVQASPIRMRAVAGANAGDWQLATELLDEFKGSVRTQSARQTAGAGENLEAARRATLESSTGGNGADGARKGKLYSRSDLMRLRIEDPDAYYDEGFQSEITRAYAEGRVR